jgi:histidinol-phosphate aminotransferase
MSIRIPDSIQRLVPYVPGKPIEETKREFGLKKVIKLASNENALGPSPRAVKALKGAVKELYRYPDASAFRFKAKLAKFLNVQAGEILLGNGSDDVIDLLIRTFSVPGEAILTTKAAFVAYKVCAQMNGVETIEADLDADLKPKLDQMLELAKKDDRIKLIFLANPNNPTGTYVKNSELLSFLKQVRQIRGGSVLVVLDYAYWEFVDAPDLTPPEKLYPEFENVMILRTFSKVYGLAGIRMGYAVGSKDLLSFVERVRQPFTNNSLALVAAEAALGDRAFVRKSFKTNLKERAKWEKFFQKNGIPFWKSQGNFLLIDAMKGFGKTGVEVFNEALKKGVIFRPVANYGLHHALRISVGTAEENAFAMKALKAMKV